MRLYGSIDNRLEENKMYCDKIEVGTGMTEYYYSDRKAYEVIDVKDQKHITVREYDHKAVGEYASNGWQLVSNENNKCFDMVKRGDYWYRVKTATLEMLNSPDKEVYWWILMNNFNTKKIREKGKDTKYDRMNVSFGIAEYYFDYEF